MLGFFKEEHQIFHALWPLGIFCIPFLLLQLVANKRIVSHYAKTLAACLILPTLAMALMFPVIVNVFSCPLFIIVSILAFDYFSLLKLPAFFRELLKDDETAKMCFAFWWRFRGWFARKTGN